jgi:hypothetical protein
MYMAKALRAQLFRLKGPALESIMLDVEIDATDSLEHPDQNANAVAFGIAPQLTPLESLVNLSSTQLLALNALAQAGTLEILPPEAPLVLFIWSASRMVPVREEPGRSELQSQDGASFMSYVQQEELAPLNSSR